MAQSDDFWIYPDISPSYDGPFGLPPHPQRDQSCADMSGPRCLGQSHPKPGTSLTSTAPKYSHQAVYHLHVGGQLVPYYYYYYYYGVDGLMVNVPTHNMEVQGLIPSRSYSNYQHYTLQPCVVLQIIRIWYPRLLSGVGLKTELWSYIDQPVTNSTAPLHSSSQQCINTALTMALYKCWHDYWHKWNTFTYMWITCVYCIVQCTALLVL